MPWLGHASRAANERGGGAAGAVCVLGGKEGGEGGGNERGWSGDREVMERSRKERKESGPCTHGPSNHRQTMAWSNHGIVKPHSFRGRGSYKINISMRMFFYRTSG